MEVLSALGDIACFERNNGDLMPVFFVIPDSVVNDVCPCLSVLGCREWANKEASMRSGGIRSISNTHACAVVVCHIVLHVRARHRALVNAVL